MGAQILKQIRCNRAGPRSLAHRNQAEAVQGFDRALRAWIKPADRFHGVADELDANWQFFPGREHVENAAATRKLAVGVDRVGRFVSTGHERVGEGVRVNVDAWGDLVRREQQRRRVWQAREQCRRGCNDDTCQPATRNSWGAKGGRGKRMQASGAGRCDLQVRLKASVGIDLRRGERQNLLLDHGIGRAFERPEEESNVADRGLDVGVLGHNVQDDAIG